MKVTVLIAALNEEEGLGPTINELKQFLNSPSILVVDGRSTDKTVEIAHRMGAEVLVQKGFGKGNAISECVQNPSIDTDYIVIIDADYTYPAEYIPLMIKILENNPQIGMVCGNRFNSTLHLGKLHNIFYFGNRTIAYIHNLLNGVEMRDPLTGLRVIRGQIIKGWKPKSKSFDIEVEINHLVEKKGFGIAEIPINYRRRLGKKKLKIRHGFIILKRIITETFP
jgi:dolichol-phosphate mannosyltransferase